MVAVGTAVARRPPRRSRRAAFPHRAPVSGRTRSAFGVWGTHAAPIRGLAASVTCLVRRCVRSMCCNSPFPRPAAFPPPSPPPMSLGIVRRFTGTMQPSDSSHLPRRLHLIDFPSRPCTAAAGTGEVRSPRFRRLPFMRNGVSDHGRAVTPCVAVHNILPSTFSTASASARLNFSRLNIPLHMIAVYASRPPSPAAPQHSLEGGSLLPYPHRTFTGWKAPASPGALRTVF